MAKSIWMSPNHFNLNMSRKKPVLYSSYSLSHVPNIDKWIAILPVSKTWKFRVILHSIISFNLDKWSITKSYQCHHTNISWIFFSTSTDIDRVETFWAWTDSVASQIVSLYHIFPNCNQSSTPTTAYTSKILFYTSHPKS